ncbi:MAG: serine/threonine-protein phosphatase [Actinomycetota bacterium]|nr:serine/threonine-protein phosphatase [Actinomycetota bacterium]
MPDAPSLNEALLAAAHLVVPDAIPGLIDGHAKGLGAESAVLYLVDLDQCALVPLCQAGGAPLQEVGIDRTLPGRCYRSLDVVDTLDETGKRTVWVPVVDGTERLGVLQLVFGGGAHGDLDEIRGFSGLVAQLVMTKGAYGDFFEVARRRKNVTVAAELLWQLLPPLTFGTEELAIAACFVPTGDLGGDAFDYGVDARSARVAVFDAMGHGLDAGLLATTAVAGYRNSRRKGFELPEMAEHVGDAIRCHFDASRFVTGILISLDIATGRLSWCVAGHPPPLLLRQGRVVKHLDLGVGLPFGVGPASEVFVEQLEPGDRMLLYTDGVTEARAASGDLFGLDQLVNLVARTAGDDPPPETMRRLMHAIEDHNDGPMRDDATVVMIEWQGVGTSRPRVCGRS